VQTFFDQQPRPSKPSDASQPASQAAKTSKLSDVVRHAPDVVRHVSDVARRNDDAPRRANFAEAMAEAAEMARIPTASIPASDDLTSDTYSSPRRLRSTLDETSESKNKSSNEFRDEVVNQLGRRSSVVVSDEDNADNEDPDEEYLLPHSAPRRRWTSVAIYLGLTVLSALFGSLAGLMLIYSVDLPQVDEIEHYRPSTTTQLYDVHGKLIGSFALQRREVIGYDDYSPLLRKAVISIEDKSFERNWGVNVVRVAGSAYHNLEPGAREQGASTLTMQLARNLFLTPERTFGRKLREVLLSMQIEHHFTKRQIFTLYGNQIYLGHGVYGFEAGAQFYFSKHARDVTLPEAAMLAALPKGPEYYSPIKYPDRALRRRNLVIDSLMNDGVISSEQADAAKDTPLGLHVAPPPNTIAPWFVEEVRRQLERKFGTEKVHQAGLRVYTTLDLDLQQTATRSVHEGLAAYEHRRGWVGQLPNLYAQGIDAVSYHHPDWDVPLQPGGFVHAVVTAVSPQQALVRAGATVFQITPEDWKWTGATTAEKILRAGDIVYVRLPDASIGSMPDTQNIGSTLPHAQLEQDSGAEGSLMAVDNSTGDVLAMVGGRDFQLSQFNRATQAMRQTGSSFKPYVYSAAVEAGVRPEETIADTPATFMTASGPYTPHNYEGNFLGNISVMHAFAESRNIPALRLAERVGISKVIDMAHRFGLRGTIQPYLPVALGAAEATLYEQVQAYSVFPNDGIRITPRYIRKVTTDDGTVLDEATPSASEAISTQTARTMMTLLQEVTRSGTAAAAAQLHHAIGGKTGTTNDFTDAWFIGFSPSITAGVWIGYDDRRQLGDKETGARAALPVWMDFMRTAIAANPDEIFLRDTPRMHTDVLRMLAVGEDASADAAASREASDAEDPSSSRYANADSVHAANLSAKTIAAKSAAPPADASETVLPPILTGSTLRPLFIPAANAGASSGGSNAAPATHPAQSVPAVLPATATSFPPANASGR
jgi:penicillin-binding protein 1A